MLSEIFISFMESLSIVDMKAYLMDELEDEVPPGFQ